MVIVRYTYISSDYPSYIPVLIEKRFNSFIEAKNFVKSLPLNRLGGIRQKLLSLNCYIQQNGIKYPQIQSKDYNLFLAMPIRRNLWNSLIYTYELEKMV